MSSSAANLETLVEFVAEDPGLIANIYQSDIDGGVAAARLMNDVFAAALDATGVNDDGVISTSDMYSLSAYIRSQPDLYNDFIVGHGDDDGDDETGYHLVQGDGGAYQFQGRDFVDTIGDAIYHVGFRIVDGRFQNEDGDQNERVADVAGWVNYFLNGKNIVWGGAGNDNLKSGNYSFALDDAAHEVFYAGAGDDRVNAKEGHDRVFGGGGNDHVMGGEGSDKIMGQGGNDRLHGEEGKDLIYGGLGHDSCPVVLEKTSCAAKMETTRCTAATMPTRSTVAQAMTSWPGKLETTKHLAAEVPTRSGAATATTRFMDRADTTGSAAVKAKISSMAAPGTM
jgi:hypothetical protein